MYTTIVGILGALILMFIGMFIVGLVMWHPIAIVGLLGAIIFFFIGTGISHQKYKRQWREEQKWEQYRKNLQTAFDNYMKNNPIEEDHFNSEYTEEDDEEDIEDSKNTDSCFIKFDKQHPIIPLEQSEIFHHVIDLNKAEQNLPMEEYADILRILLFYTSMKTKMYCDYSTYERIRNQIFAHADLIAPLYKFIKPDGMDDSFTPEAIQALEDEKYEYRLKAKQLADEGKMFENEWFDLHKEFLLKFYDFELSSQIYNSSF
ncbi:MAG: hypothetical protein E7668_04550 [Ruminococcaceae bacterium]|nr:hypothetical protein [Oscillospiraceae bacterium]